MTRAKRAGLRPTLLLGVAAIVLGILGMHGLSVQGAAADPAHPVATTAAHSEAHPGGAHPEGAQSEGVPGPHHGGGSHDMGSMVMLCAAMLAAAAAGLLALRALRRGFPPSWTIARSTPGPRAPAWFTPVGTGPPPVWRFSVIRC